jgi:hypothetical protein
MREQELQLHRVTNPVRNTYIEYEIEKEKLKELNHKDYEKAVKRIAERLLL